MECVKKSINITTNDTNNNNALSPTSSASSSPPSPAVVLSPCAACKILRRRCIDKCVLAPYFPPTEPLKFSIAHRVFGASNIIKLLQELPEDQRADAVNSMVYEANARLRDPVYGCAGAISQLQRRINELQAELAKAQVEIINVKYHNYNLNEFINQQMGHIMQNNNNNNDNSDDDIITPELISTSHDQSSTSFGFLDESGDFGVALELGSSMDMMEIFSMI